MKTPFFIQKCKGWHRASFRRVTEESLAELKQKQHIRAIVLGIRQYIQRGDDFFFGANFEELNKALFPALLFLRAREKEVSPKEEYSQ